MSSTELYHQDDKFYIKYFNHKCLLYSMLLIKLEHVSEMKAIFYL